MKGYIFNVTLHNRCDNRKPDQANSVDVADRFLKGEESIKVGKKLISEVILFCELHVTWEGPHEMPMSVHKKIEGMRGQSGASCLFLSGFGFTSWKIKIQSVREGHKYIEM